MICSVRDATVRFGSRTALDRVSMDVTPGQVSAVVGGDGAGKSTLLRAIVGEVVLTSGNIEAPAEEKIGYLPASAGSWLDLTVTENMEFVGGAYGLRGAELHSRIDELLEAAGLQDARGRLSGQLSGGMRRKLGFCLAVIHDPLLLVLDEPSTGVDPVSRVDLWRLISKAAAGGAGVIMSTTYLDEAERSSALLVLDSGVTVVQGTPDEALASLPGTLEAVETPTRREWAWRRGRLFHEYWPEGAAPSEGAQPITPDLEDIVIAASLRRRAMAAAASASS